MVGSTFYGWPTLVEVEGKAGRLGFYLKVARQARRMTQVQVAKSLKVSDQSVARYEKGECVPDSLLLMSMSELYGVSLDELKVRVEAK